MASETRAIVVWRPEVNKIHQFDALGYLRQCESDSVHCMVTSPPYWGLRDYGVEGQIGLEDSLEGFIDGLAALFREARRVLHPRGTCWINMGDSYANDAKWGGSTGGKHANRLHGQTGIGRQKVHTGLKAKDLVGQPWRLALALQADGWWLRSDIIWAKRNPMPESVTDRPTKSHEHIFLLTKNAKYYYDAEAIREDSQANEATRNRYLYNFRYSENDRFSKGVMPGSNGHTGLHNSHDNIGADRNKRDVWFLSSEAFPEAHFATFPQKLIEPCVLAGCPPMVCVECGEGWTRVVEVSGGVIGQAWNNHRDDHVLGNRSVNAAKGGNGYIRESKGWEAGCQCGAATEPGIVLDMFMGSGTTALVATKLGRRFMGCDLNSDYVEMANRRLSKGVQVDMFAKAGMAI